MYEELMRIVYGAKSQYIYVYSRSKFENTIMLIL
jgi:hypothetical protein